MRLRHSSPAAAAPSAPVSRRLRTRLGRAGLAVVVAVVVIRAALPWGVKTALNRALARNATINGHVENVDLEIWRGAYQIHELTLARRAPAGSPPFFEADLVDFSVDWNALFHGSLLARGRLEEPVVDLGALPEKQDAGQAAEETGEAAQTVMPMKISRLVLERGKIRFPGNPASPLGRVEVQQVNGVAGNIRMTEDPSNTRPTTLRATARAPGNGLLAIDLRYDPFSDPIRFDVDASVKGIDLPELNPVLRAAAGMDVQSGTGDIFAEARAGDGRFEGYVKPIIKDLNVLNLRTEDAGLGQKIKEGLADVAKGIFKNDRQNSVGTRIPFSGSFENPKIGVWGAVTTVLRHAFVRALSPRVEDRI